MNEAITHIVEGCRAGNRTAQLELYRRFSRPLYAACLRIIGRPEEAEEAMQDTILKVLTRIDQYRPTQSFEGWIRQVAVHTAIDYVRQQLPAMEELSDNYQEPDPDEWDEEILAESVQQVKGAIQTMASGYRVVLSLYFFEGYDLEEIAEILQAKPASVRVQFMRAKRKLLEQLTCDRNGEVKAIHTGSSGRV
ncbi:MAG: sigma-70 family RNA polymerase sigma factor [Parabacteroides sp.]|nr:sigma-70 family RNA polymerase sigma factor [bacterium]MDY4102053.1 sigma-70 family RNA polymerase sigma factor [Parabacteroides sp.]